MNPAEDYGAFGMWCDVRKNIPTYKSSVQYDSWYITKMYRLGDALQGRCVLDKGQVAS